MKKTNEIDYVKIVIAVIMIILLLPMLVFLPLALTGMFRNPMVTVVWIAGAWLYWKFCFEPIIEVLGKAGKN